MWLDINAVRNGGNWYVCDCLIRLNSNVLHANAIVNRIWYQTLDEAEEEYATRVGGDAAREIAKKRLDQ